MRLNLFFLFLALTAVGAEPNGQAAAQPGGWRCGAGELRYSGKSAKADFCFREHPYQLLSRNCLAGGCELKKKVKQAPDALFDADPSPVGNPAFRLCAKLGGTARVLEFKFGKEWRAGNECRFSDHSFASVDFLEYLARRDRPWLD